jgi:hypothetical protein
MITSVPGIANTLNVLGFLAIAVTATCLAGTFTINSDVYRAFFLGAFFTGLLGIILLFGFSKVIGLLVEIRDKTTPQT